MLRFAYRLALELGIWDVDGMLESMSYSQFMSWYRYSMLEPFTRERIDRGLGMLCSLVANYMRGKGKRPYKPEDMIPDYTKTSFARRAIKPLTSVSMFSAMTKALLSTE